MSKLGAIKAGLARANELGLSKPLDVAITVLTTLEGEGYRIVRAPRRGSK